MAFVCGVYIARQVTAGRAASVTVAVVSLSIYIACLWLPAHLQAAGLIESKLERAGIARPPSMGEIDQLALRWSIELTILTFVEFLVWRTRHGANATQVHALYDIDQRWERTARLLVIVGGMSMVIFPPLALESRAEGGQGFGTLMRTFLIVGLAVIVYYRGFGKPFNWLLLILGTVVLILGNVRSPLLVLVCAYLASEIRLGRLRKIRRLVGVLAVIIIFALAGSVMSGLRANTARNYGYTTGEVIAQALDNPWIAPFEAGLDTLDGYRFSERIAPLEEPQPMDLFNTVLTFVPREIWKEKPSDLSVAMSSKYLNYQGSGQYLSPTGYFTLTLGSYSASLVGLGAFSLVISLLARKYAARFGYSFVLVVSIRFLLGGSSFDLYYGLTLALPTWAAYSAVTLSDRLRARRPLKAVTFYRVMDEDQAPGGTNLEAGGQRFIRGSGGPRNRQWKLKR